MPKPKKDQAVTAPTLAQVLEAGNDTGGFGVVSAGAFDLTTPTATLHIASDGYVLIQNGGNASLELLANGDVNLSTPTVSVSVRRGNLYLDGLPIFDPAAAGALWNDNGTLKVSAG